MGPLGNKRTLGKRGGVLRSTSGSGRGSIKHSAGAWPSTQLQTPHSVQWVFPCRLLKDAFWQWIPEEEKKTPLYCVFCNARWQLPMINHFALIRLEYIVLIWSLVKLCGNSLICIWNFLLCHYSKSVSNVFVVLFSVRKPLSEWNGLLVYINEVLSECTLCAWFSNGWLSWSPFVYQSPHKFSLWEQQQGYVPQPSGDALGEGKYWN